MSLLDTDRQTTLDAIHNYGAVRRNLQRPKNAKIDNGINLKREVWVSPIEEAIKEKKSRTQALAEFRRAETERIKQESLERQIETIRNQLAVLEAKLASFRKRPSAKTIQETVASHYGVSLDDILSPRRFGGLIEPRQVAVYLCKKLTLLSLMSVGGLFNRDHSTIINSVRKVEARRKENPELDATINDLTGQLMAGII